jgi:hypothetical protein
VVSKRLTTLDDRGPDLVAFRLPHAWIFDLAHQCRRRPDAEFKLSASRIIARPCLAPTAKLGQDDDGGDATGSGPD